MRIQRPLLPFLGMLWLAQPVSGGPENTPVPESFWGMHVHFAQKQWPNVPFSSWRLWDADVAWPQLEPRKGEWHFDLLDSYVALAEQHHVRVLLLLGLSPQWASSRPTEHSTFFPGNAAPPASLDDWRNYVKTVASRYKGRIHEYELWNEPNFKDFYTGTVEEMVALSREASKAIKAVDPTAIVVSPSATTKLGVPWLEQFLRAGGGAYADVIGYHFYVFPDGPEAMLPLLKTVRETVHTLGNDKPIWDTEGGWGASAKNRPSAMITGMAPAYVARAFILNWFGGAQRFYWYAWDNHWWVTIEMTDKQGGSSAAASAYEQVRSWMLGKQFNSCQPQEGGTWVCSLGSGATAESIVWNPERTTTFRFSGTRSVTSLDGTKRSANGQTEAGPSPVLIR